MTARLIGEEDLIRKVQEYTFRAHRLLKFWIMTLFMLTGLLTPVEF